MGQSRGREGFGHWNGDERVPVRREAIRRGRKLWVLLSITVLLLLFLPIPFFLSYFLPLPFSFPSKVLSLTIWIFSIFSQTEWAEWVLAAVDNPNCDEPLTHAHCISHFLFNWFSLCPRISSLFSYLIFPSVSLDGPELEQSHSSKRLGDDITKAHLHLHFPHVLLSCLSFLLSLIFHLSSFFICIFSLFLLLSPLSHFSFSTLFQQDARGWRKNAWCLGDARKRYSLWISVKNFW